MSIQEIVKSIKGKFLFVTLLSLPSFVLAGRYRAIQKSGDQSDTAAINLNFNLVNNELDNVVHKTSTETVRGNKTFTGSVIFSTVTITSATITNLSSTTGTITNIVSSSITLNGLNFAGNPVGTVVMYVSSSVTPSGWLQCDGSSVSTTTYSRLFSVIGYVYGGSGANFSLPDFRGVFPKGDGTTSRAAGKDASGNFYAGTIGTYSTDKMQGHIHVVAGGGTTGTPSYTSGTGTFGATGGINVNTASPSSDGTNGTPRGGHTTEPQSLGIAFIIYTGV